VADSGSGIAPEHLPHVFDRFYKVDESRVAGSSGSGLGLSIAKAIVERHGGSIDVASRPGCTRFTVTLPQGGESP
jgi:two-component system OmpR family sensor kinase